MAIHIYIYICILYISIYMYFGSLILHSQCAYLLLLDVYGYTYRLYE